jgi:hypothetical protein
MLAFISGLVSQKVLKPSELGSIAAGLMWFVSGITLVGLSAMFAYFTNLSIASSSGLKKRFWEHPFIKDTTRSKIWRRVGIGCQVAAVLCALSSLAAFVIGAISVYHAVVGLGSLTPNFPGWDVY